MSGSGHRTLAVLVGGGGFAVAAQIREHVAGNSVPVVGDVSDVTIEANNSTAALTFTVADVETASASLTVTGSSSNQTLVPNGNIVFTGTAAARTVTVTPAAGQSGTATISLSASDGVASGADTFVLTVTASSGPEIAVSGNSVDITDGNAAPGTADHTDFGSITAASGTLVRTFTINNSVTATASLTLGTVTVGGANAADFSVTTAPVSPVAAGGSTTFQVTFNPSATGLRSATLSFTNNDTDENPFNFSIQGTGTASNDADLSALALSAGTLNPTFAAATTAYAASVSNATTSLTVTPTVSGAGATITVNGTAVASGIASNAISLNFGSNVITTVVTAQNGTTTKTYTVTVTRAAPPTTLAFSAAAYTFASKNATGQPNTIVLTLDRSNGTTGAVSVDVSTAAGGTLDALDYTFTSPTTVNFADGQTTAFVNVPLRTGVAPLPGTINFTLGSATNGAGIGAINTTTVTVRAPDAVAPKLVLTSPTAGDSGATFSVAGSVIETDEIDRVTLLLNGVRLANATLGTKTNGVTPFAATFISAENGPNTLLVQAFDVNGTASLVKKVEFAYTNERPQFAGNYNGIASPTVVAPPAGDLNNASGFVTLSVTKTGMFSGKVLMGGATLPIKGVFASNGTARFNPALGDTFALVKNGKVPVNFGDLALSVSAGGVNGTIGTTSTVACDRAAFDGKLSQPDAATLANKGKYTAVLPNKAQPVLTTAQFPQGDGIGGITILKSGKLSFVGTLADGTPFAASAPLSANYEAPLYAQLYGKKGCIAGVVTVSLADLANANANSDISGNDFLWLRPANNVAKHYPAGWPGGVVVDLIAASYNNAKQTPAASVFPGLNANGEVTLQFADGKLTAPVKKDALIFTANQVTNVPATDKGFKLTVVSGTGGLNGNFTHTDGTKPKFKATIYQKGPTPGGYGYFLSTVPKAGLGGESGGVSITAKP